MSASSACLCAVNHVLSPRDNYYKRIILIACLAVVQTNASGTYVYVGEAKDDKVRVIILCKLPMYRAS